MASQVMRITLKAYDHQLVDQSAGKIIETVKKTGSQVSGPVPLPTKKEVVTILRAVHKYKDSREQFEQRTHKRLIDITAPSQKTVDEPEIVTRWYEQTHDDFRFCFKFPATISHQAALRHCDDLSSEFFARLAPLASRIGQYWLQLPATFGPRDLPALWHFLDGLPKDFTYGVEVRHPEFFAKGEAEQQLNRGLHERNVNRVILDSRPVHSAAATSPAMIDAQQNTVQTGNASWCVHRHQDEDQIIPVSINDYVYILKGLDIEATLHSCRNQHTGNGS